MLNSLIPGLSAEAVTHWVPVMTLVRLQPDRWEILLSARGWEEYMETDSGHPVFARTSLERVCRLPDRELDRHLGRPESPGGSVPDLPSLPGTCKKGRRFLFIFPFPKERDKTPNF